MSRENLIRNSRSEYRRPFRRNFLDELLFPFESTLLPEINRNWANISFNSDFKEDKHNYYIDAELPGFDKDDIDVQIENNQISIQAEKKQEEENESENKKFHFSEISYGSFSRIYSFLNLVDVENVKANFKNGMLRLTVPKLIDNKSSKVTIE